MNARSSYPSPPSSPSSGGAGPVVIVCAGGGGVGKTTSSAALGLALARAGKRTLVVTIDPARRLADALGVPIGSKAHVVSVDPDLGDRFYALMPEPRGAAEQLIQYLFEEEPETLARFRKNRVYLAMADAMAGAHELVCMALVARAAKEHAFEYLVVDTAPSRYALDFVAYPSRLAALLESRAMGFMSGLAGKAEEASSNFAADWAKKRVEGALGRALGATFIADLSAMFMDLSRVRERFASLARQAEELLIGPRSRYVLVGAPTGAACADVQFLSRKLVKLGRHTNAILLNRADLAPRPWARALLAHPETPAAMREALMLLDAERSARTVAADDVAETLGDRMPNVGRVRMPLVEAADPAIIVRALSQELAGHLPLLAGLQ